MSAKKTSDYTLSMGLMGSMSGTYNEMIITKKGVIYMKKKSTSKKAPKT